MKTIYLGQDTEFDVIYDIVTNIRKIEDACDVEDKKTPGIFRIDGKRLLSDLLFYYKNSQAARSLSPKQVSVKFIQDIESHLAHIPVAQHSANDSKIEQYKQDLNEYLEQLSIIQGQLVDIPEWVDLREKFKSRMLAIDSKKYPSVTILTNFIDSMERAHSSQAEKIHKTIDMMVKSYLTLIKQHKVENKAIEIIENQLAKTLEAFLAEDLNINIHELKPNENIIHLTLHDPQKAEAFKRAYGRLKISIA